MKKKENDDIRTGWTSILGKIAMGALLFEAVTGLSITFLRFHAFIQWSVLVHTIVGLATLLPIAWYYVRHWQDYYRDTFSYVVLLGYVGKVALLACTVTGAILTFQGLFGIRTSLLWRRIHLVTTFLTLGTALPHVLLIVIRDWRSEKARPIRVYLGATLAIAVVAIPLILVLGYVYSGQTYNNRFPEDYSFLYGKDRPFAPSLAQTSTGGAFDARSLSGSESCGTKGCHSQILAEWKPSTHRYAAMDSLFQLIQKIMAEQNGPESTRYCGGCHDPISLFSGTKNIFAENLTDQHGYQEGVSCLTCHAVRETDLRGNANYVITQPKEYLWQQRTEGIERVARDFLIRTYPSEHSKLSKRMYKSPEYCAACHKQFIDEEINRVGWVQLQNQYDNWAASRWYTKDDPTKTIECRECHMPLEDSSDPAAGDPSDYNRSESDGKHRSHRFIAANQFMPKLLELEGWEEQVRLTELWLQGKYEIPEIQDKWVGGPIVQLALDVPENVSPGEEFPVRVILTSRKVGHDYPTGPLDIIQSWVEVRVEDERGNLIFSSGTRDERNFIEPGSFLFKAEPVDQQGNLIDRHNLWEMVGVRYRRSIFPGFSDTVEYRVSSPAAVVPEDAKGFTVPGSEKSSRYQVTAILYYRKADQFLLNFFLGDDSGITASAVEITRAKASIDVRMPLKGAGPDSPDQPKPAATQGR